MDKQDDVFYRFARYNTRIGIISIIDQYGVKAGLEMLKEKRTELANDTELKEKLYTEQLYTFVVDGEWFLRANGEIGRVMYPLPEKTRVRIDCKMVMPIEEFLAII